MENLAANGVLDLGICNPPMGKLILPPGVNEGKKYKSISKYNPETDKMEEVKTYSLSGAPDMTTEDAHRKFGVALPPVLVERTWEGEWTFEKQYGFAPPKAVGPYMIVALYKPKLSDVMIISDETRSKQKWISNVGRLISLGSACFKGDQFQHWSEDDIPKIGDWIHFKHNSGPVNKFRGIDIVTMYDESINMQLEDPEHVSRD